MGNEAVDDMAQPENVPKMSWSFEESFSRVRARRIGRETIHFDPDETTTSELRFILRCLCINITGDRGELLERLCSKGIEKGDTFCFNAELFPRSCVPVSMISTFLGAMGEAPWGDNEYISSRVRRYLPDADFDPEIARRMHWKKRLESSEEDVVAVLIKDSLENGGRMPYPTQLEKKVLGRYGYFYVEALTTFVHKRTQEGLCGCLSDREKAILQSLPPIDDGADDIWIYRSGYQGDV